MSIYTTKYISRKDAIARIKDICEFVSAGDYVGLEKVCFEPEANLQSFVDSGIDFDISTIDQWTNKMLERVMDKEFFRFSMFDNYLIND